MFERAKAASRELALTDDQRKSDLLNLLADAILTHKDAILEANALDLARMDRASPASPATCVTWQPSPPPLGRLYWRRPSTTVCICAVSACPSV